MHATTSATPAHTASHIDDPAMLGLHTLAWDSVACIYSHSTHSVTQLALRPARDEVDRDALEALYEQVKEQVAPLIATVLELAESGALPRSARAFRVEQRPEKEGQGGTGSSSSGYSLSFQRQSSAVSASKWVWQRADEEVRWSASKWRVDFARV